MTLRVTRMSKIEKIGLIFAVLFIALAFVSIGIASVTIYVPDDYSKIQWAVDNASAGDTIIVRDGTYIENIKVDKRLTIRSENASDSTIVQAANSSNPTFEVSADGVNISGLTVKNPSELKHIERSIGRCELTVKNPVEYEILVEEPYEIPYEIPLEIPVKIPLPVEISFPTENKSLLPIGDLLPIGEVIEEGFSLSKVRNVTIANNIIEDCQRGINISSSINVTVANNSIKSSIDSIYSVNLNNSTIMNNFCNSKIHLYRSHNNSILKNNCDGGIFLDSSNNNTITNNSCYGIRLYKSNDNGVSKNNCSNNRDGGIFLDSSHNNLITNNNCSNNNFTMSVFDKTTGRMEVVHYGNGISVRDSNNNIIYLNNFINNGKNVDSRGSTNLWNSTEKISYTYNGKTYTNYLGNYWDDYTGKDADGDGIGDIPYSINSDNDHYPLIKPYENYRISTFSGGNAK